MTCPKLANKLFSRECLLHEYHQYGAMNIDLCNGSGFSCERYRIFREEVKSLTNEMKERISKLNLSEIDYVVFTKYCPYSINKGFLNITSHCEGRHNIIVSALDEEVYCSSDKRYYLFCEHYINAKNNELNASEEKYTCKYFDILSGQCLVTKAVKVPKLYENLFCRPNGNNPIVNKYLCSLYIYAEVNEVERQKSTFERGLETIKENIAEQKAEYQKRMERLQKRGNRELIEIMLGKRHGDYRDRVISKNILIERGVIYIDNEGKIRRRRP